MKLRGLYAITPEAGDLEHKLRLALEGGIALLQYRSKACERTQAAAVVRMARDYGVPVIINDDVALALDLDAAGAHLGRDDGDLRAARKRLGPRILGASCYNELERARIAVRAGADYIAFGSVFASPTKPEAIRAPLRLFGEAKALGVPIAAIGGVTLENAPQLIAAGADLLAVITDLFDAPDIRARARAYGKLFA
ncbi:MAG TPA: thiamine phosphate synthase [Burkholderiales bacterium]|jgi:thiamine-phosphate pyrophosphorylase|nr:thiamine phosphate synthase [Burkholderiales bacterium]